MRIKVVGQHLISMQSERAAICCGRCAFGCVQNVMADLLLCTNFLYVFIDCKPQNLLSLFSEWCWMGRMKSVPDGQVLSPHKTPSDCVSGGRKSSSSVECMHCSFSCTLYLMEFRGRELFNDRKKNLILVT